MKMTSRLLVLVSCGLLLAGCGTTQRSTTGTVSEGAFQDRATEVAAAWQERGITAAWTKGFVPLQDLVVEPNWSPNEVLKASYGNGWIRTSAPLPDLGGRGGHSVRGRHVPLGSARRREGGLRPTAPAVW